MKVEEPVFCSYETNSLQALKNRAARMILDTQDENLLMSCMEELRAKDMPCVFSDEEYMEEIALSEKTPLVSQEDVEKELERWGLAG